MGSPILDDNDNDESPLVTKKHATLSHNTLVESRYKLSFIEQWLVGLFISMVEPDDVDFKPYVICVSDLANRLEIDGGDVEAGISRAVDGLMNTTIKLDEGEDKVKVRWLSSSRYQPEKGMVSLRFDPELKPLLLQLKEEIAVSTPATIIQLKHIHSIRLYRLLKPYELIGKCKFSVADLRQALRVDEDKYSQHRDFRRWVLKDAQAELQEKADILFEFVEERRGRTVEFIDFMITTNGETSANAAGSVSETVWTPEPDEASQNATVGRLIDMGIAYTEAVQLVGNFDGGRIDKAIAYTEEMQKTGHVRNPAILVVVAIQNGFVGSCAEDKAKMVESYYEHQDKLESQPQVTVSG